MDRRGWGYGRWWGNGGEAGGDHGCGGPQVHQAWSFQLHPRDTGALEHAHRVALGLSPPAKAILICPLASLSDPSPAPSAEVTPAFSRMSRRPLQGRLDLQVPPFASNLPGAPAGPKGLPWAPGRELGLKLGARKLGSVQSLKIKNYTYFGTTGKSVLHRSINHTTPPNF